jgi:outer membrane beta-barrel protein
MRTFLVLGWLLAAVPTVVLAQTSPGLDLSEPEKPEKTEKRPPEKGDAPASPGLDLSEPPVPRAAPPAPRAPEPAAAAAAPKEQLPFSEKDVALGDKVKAVQRKGFLKKGRFEVAPIFSASVNDAFFQKFGGGLRLAYNVQDTFALAVRGTYYTPYRTDAVRDGKLAFQSQLLSSQLYYQAMVDGIWSPVYGKAAFLGRTIVHFDLFLAAGFGAVWSATSLAPRSEGPHLAADLGGGVRFYPKEWLAFELGMMATLYPDQPVESVPGTMQNVLTANVGFSFFFPFRFEYEYP